MEENCLLGRILWGASHAESADSPNVEGLPLSFWKGMLLR